MALLNCKECDKQVSTQAKHCPNCGAKAPKKPVPKWAVIVNLIFWPLIIYACTHISEPVYTPAEKIERAIREAVYGCGFYVEKTLNDPDSAKFDYENMTAIRRPHDVIDVQFKVRGKNAFNATIVVTYQCRVKRVGAYEWKAVSVHQIS